MSIVAFLSILYFVGLMLQQATGGGAAASGSTDMRGKDVKWHSDMQDTRIPTAENLAGYMKLYQTLLHDTIPKMYRSVTSGGTGQGRGRYKQVDTARISALEEAIADLSFGKVPTAETHKNFIAGNYREMTNVAKKKWMEDWKDRTCPDIRATKKGKDALRQTSIIDYAVLSGAHHGLTRGAFGGRYALSPTPSFDIVWPSFVYYIQTSQP